MRFSLRRKLFLALLLSSLLTHGAAGWAILNRIDAGAQAEIVAQARATAILTRTLIDRRGRSLADSAQLLAALPGVQEAIAARDRSTLAGLVQTYPKQLDVTAVLFADPDGVALVGTTPSSDPPGRYLGLDQALAGLPSWSVERGASGLTLFGFAPIVQVGRTVGAVGLGEALDQRFVDRAKADTGFECSILTPEGKPLASSLGHGLAFPIGPILPASVDTTEAGAGPRELVRLENRTFGTYALPLRDPARQTVGYVVVGSSLDALDRARDEVRRLFLAIGVLVLASNVAIAWVLARLLTVPLQRLTLAARRMAGGDYGQPTVVAGRDEIGELARAFEQMRVRVGEADRLKSALISTVSHELRTPLTHIKGFARTLLLGGWDEASRREFLQVIDEESDRLRELVDNLLDMSRIEAGVLRLDRQPLALAPFLAHVVERQRSTAPDRRVELEIASDLPVVEADARRIEQVLRNLLDNAVKYSPRGSPVCVRALLDETGRSGLAGNPTRVPRRDPSTPARSIVVEVADQGIGIAEQDQPRIFERFYRVDDGLDRQSKGSGLGLAICQGIIKAHGGRIWVESAPGAGSVFRFTLPVHAVPSPSTSGAGRAREGDDDPRR